MPSTAVVPRPNTVLSTDKTLSAERIGHFICPHCPSIWCKSSFLSRSPSHTQFRINDGKLFLKPLVKLIYIFYIWNWIEFSWPKIKTQFHTKVFRFVLVYSEGLVFLYVFIKFIYLFVGGRRPAVCAYWFPDIRLRVSDLVVRPSPTEPSHQLAQTCLYQHKWIFPKVWCTS